MAYNPSNPPSMIAQSVGAAPAIWVYVSEDIHTDVDAENYFTNGMDLGMRVNDVVIAIKTTATIGATLHVTTEVSSDGASVAAAILA